MLENHSHALIWDFSTQTDHVIGAWIPNIFDIDEESSKHQIIEFVVPYATRVNIKEIEKNGKYQDQG